MEVTVYNWCNQPCAVGNIIRSDDMDWYLCLGKGRLRQRLLCGTGKNYRFTQEGSQCLRKEFLYRDKKINVYFRCESGSKRMFLTKVCVLPASTTDASDALVFT